MQIYKAMKKYLILFLTITFLLQFNPVKAQQPVEVLNPLQTPSTQTTNAQTAVAEPAGLQVFGANFFTGVDMADKEFTTPVAAEYYYIGAGDRLGIHLGGKAQENFEVMVTADGKIYLPTAGVFSVQGLSLAEMQRLLDKSLRRFYSNYTLDLLLIAPKMVRVAVIGDVGAPGFYTLSALNTVLDAVARAQGPTKRGSLRDIQLFRGDSLMTRVDLYDYLLRPEIRSDLLLQSGDRIFVAPSRNRVLIDGEVSRPAIYELNPTKQERLTDLLDLAGGLTDRAFPDKIEWSRMQANGARQIGYVDYHAALADSQINIVLQNEDAIRVFSKLEQVPRQIVSIQGEVNRPGEYALEENMRLSDLILKAGSLKRSAYLLNAQVAKVEPKKAPVIIEVDLQRLLLQHEDSLDVVLDADDQVFIRRIPEWKVGATVEVSGEVIFPGYYAIVEDTTMLSHVLAECGGFTRDALISEAKLIRRREIMLEDKEFERLREMTRDQMSKMEYEYLVMKQNSTGVNEIVVDFHRLVVKKDSRQDIALRDGDIITIPKTPRVVMVTGRVARSGGVLYKKGANLKYYISQAGGFSWDADKRRTKVIKSTGEIEDDEDVREFQPGDRIWVPRKPDHNYWQIFRDTMLVAGQIAAIFLVIQNASK
ncbi:SLBB domain-containing protein [candidate division KSB1 bacterium]|nr:SLBB domain-containing protein [candidate division KSB1 bacterium]